MSKFALHPQLAKDGLELATLELSLLLLMNDRRYPWLILVPRRAAVTEIHQLSERDQQRLMRESSAISQLMEQLFSPDKLNMAAIGNRVEQLHLHVIARYRHDACWPEPVWGRGNPEPYSFVEQQQMHDLLQPAVMALEL